MQIKKIDEEKGIKNGTCKVKMVFMLMLRQRMEDPHRIFRRFDPDNRTPREAFSKTLLDAPRIPDEGTPRLWQAYGAADCVFQGKKRKDGRTDAIFHSLAVAEYALVLLKGNQHAGCVAILHDCIEDGAKNGVPLHHEDIRTRFDFRIARDVDFLTTPKCARKNPDGTHVWIPASDSRYAYVEEVYNKQNPMPPEVYREMRGFYLGRMISVEGIRAFCIKLCDAMSNLEDIENLAPERRERKLKENMLLIELAARLHWGLYVFMAESLEEWNYPVPDLRNSITTQEQQGVIILPARAELNLEMARKLPIRHPNNSAISVYGSTKDINHIEVGLPYEASELPFIVKNRFEGIGLRFKPQSSLFGRCFHLDARERIFRVFGIDSPQKYEAFVDGLRGLVN